MSKIHHIKLSSDRTEQWGAQAMRRLYQLHSFNPNWRKWLEHLAKQWVHEVVVDREFVNNCFANDGRTKRLNVVLNNQLDTVPSEFGETLRQAC